MSKKYIMGIDGGTQSTKVSIFDTEGHLVCEGKQLLKPMYCPKLGIAEHPDDDLWEALKSATKKVLTAFKGDVKDIVGVGICEIRCCRVHLKKDGTLADNVISWMDVRLATPYQHLNKDVKYVCQTSGYITHRLTGEFKDTSANYEVNWPIDIQKANWSDDDAVIKSMNIPREMLLELKQPGEVLGYITNEASLVTGLPKGLPVVATANDKGTETLGAGILPISSLGKITTGALGDIKPNEGTIVLSLGTYISALALGYEYIGSDSTDFWGKTASTSFWTTSSSVPGVYMYESMTGIRRGMWTLTWLKDILSADLLAELDKKGMSGEQYLDNEALTVNPGSDGLMIILDWLPKPTELFKRGMMIGFDIRHTKAHIYRALLESIALTMNNIIMPMFDELKISKKSLIVSGGGSNSDVFMQIISDVFGCDVSRNEVNGAAGIGSAICVAVATRIYKDFKSAVSNMSRIKDTFTPNKENHELYTQMNEKVYKKITQHTDEILKESHKIFGPK